jgi:hypothetical protein
VKAKLTRTGKVKVNVIVTFKTDGNVWRKNNRLGMSPGLGS